MTQATPSPWYTIRRAEAGARLAVVAKAGAEPVQAVAEICVIGPIGTSWFEETVTAKAFIDELQALPAGDVVVRIATDGGSVTDGLAIYNALKRCQGQVTTIVDPHAFSIGSLIAMAGTRRIMSANGMMMLHAPWTYTDGNATELRATADMLDTYSKAMATSYAAATGKPAAEYEALFAAGNDKFYTADEALAAGLITEVSEGAAVSASAQRHMVQAMARYASHKSPPAAPAAQPPKEQPLMTTPQPQAAGTQTPSTPPDNTAVIEAARREGAAVEAKRRDAITQAAAKHLSVKGMEEVVAACIADHACTVEAAHTKILTKLGENTASAAGTHVVTVEDEADKFNAAASNAIMARAGVKGADNKPVAYDSANPLKGMTLIELVKASVERGGRSTKGMDPMEVVGYAFQSTSDFPILLQNVMHKSLLAAYATAPDTWSRFCAVGSVTDFRAHNRYRVGSLANISVKNENGEYKHLSIPDGERASVSVKDRGAIITISREMIVNDDMSAFTTLPASLGRAARRSIEADVYALLASNPTLGDGKALFHVDHGNLAGTGTAPSVVAIDAGRVAMASQKDASKNDFLDITPAVALAPMSLGSTLRVINGAMYDPDTANKLQRPNAVAGIFRDIVDSPRLSGTGWYMLADANVAPVIEVDFLNGNQTPRIEQEAAFTTGGGRMRVQLDWGVTAIDYRGAWMNPGA